MSLSISSSKSDDTCDVGSYPMTIPCSLTSNTLEDGAPTLQPRTSVSFEWINVEDKDARRKARSHVIRESKHRQKLEKTLRNQRLKDGGQRQLACAAIEPKSYEQGISKETIALAGSDTRNYLPSVRTVLEGLVDPFNQMPAKLMTAKDLGLVDHCK